MPATLLEKNPAQVFSCEFFEISKNRTQNTFVQSTSGSCFWSMEHKVPKQNLTMAKEI